MRKKRIYSSLLIFCLMIMIFILIHQYSYGDSTDSKLQTSSDITSTKTQDSISQPSNSKPADDSLSYNSETSTLYMDKGAQENTKTLFKRIMENIFTLGIFPNTDGFMDGKFIFHRSYLDYFSSGIDVNYSSRSANFTEEGKFDSKSVIKELVVTVDVLKFIYPIQISEDIVLGFKGGIGGIYLYKVTDTSGYKVNMDITTYFNQNIKVNNGTPSIKAELSGAITNYFSYNISGESLPWIYIKERGTKRYSTYTNPINYSVKNYNMGYQISGSFLTHDILIGDFQINANFLNFSGKYQTQAEIFDGNYKVTVKTYDPFSRFTLDLEFLYKLTYLNDFLSFTPIVSFAYSKHKEIYAGEVNFNDNLFKFGLLVSYN